MALSGREWRCWNTSDKDRYDKADPSRLSKSTARRTRHSSHQRTACGDAFAHIDLSASTDCSCRKYLDKALNQQQVTHPNLIWWKRKSCWHLHVTNTSEQILKPTVAVFSHPSWRTDARIIVPLVDTFRTVLAASKVALIYFCRNNSYILWNEYSAVGTHRQLPITISWYYLNSIPTTITEFQSLSSVCRIRDRKKRF